MSDISIESIIKVASSFIQGSLSPDDPLYAALNTQVEYLPLCFQILNECFQYPDAQILAAFSLENLTKIFATQWPKETIDEFKGSIFNWLNLCIQNASITDRKTKIILVKIISCYVIAVKVTNSSFNSLANIAEEIDTALPGEEPLVICYKFLIFQLLMEKFKDIKDTPSSIAEMLDQQYNFSFGLFNRALEIIRPRFVVNEQQEIVPLDGPENDLILATALDMINSIFEYHIFDVNPNAVKKDEIIAEELNLKPIWREEATNADNYKLLFSITKYRPNFRQVALNIIYKLCCVKKAMFTSPELHLNCFMTTIVQATQLMSVPEFFNSDHVFLLAKILYKIRYRTDHKITDEAPEYHTFLALLRERTNAYIQQNYIETKPNILFYIIKFWCTCLQDNTPFHDILFTYIHDILELPTKDAQDTLDNILDEISKGTVPDYIKVIPQWCNKNIGEFAADICTYLSGTQEKFGQFIQQANPSDLPELQKCDYQMSFIICFLVSILKIILSVPNETQIQAFQVIIKSLVDSKEIIKICAEANLPYFERSLMIFCNSFRHMSIADKINDIYKDVDYYFKDLQNAANLLIERITMTLREFPNDLDTINLGVKALDSVIKLLSEKKLVKESINTELLLQSFVTEPFEFMVNVKNKRSTINASRVMTTIALSSQPATEYFMSFLENNFQLFLNLKEENVFKALLYNFIGTFEACKRKQDFDIFFRWLFPDHLAQIITVLFSITSSSLRSDFFKFLYSIIVPLQTDSIKTGPKIAFPPHSPDGVHLFQLFAEALTTGFRMILTEITENPDQTKDLLKPFKPMCRLMSEIMRAEYVMFDAFELYEDTTISDLLNSYFGLLNVINIEIYFNVASFTILVSLIDALSNFHMPRVINCNPEFVILMFDIITQVFEGKDDKELGKSGMKAAKNLIKFFADNAADPNVGKIIQACETRIRNITALLWMKLLNDKEAVPYDIAQILKPIFILIPNLIQFVHNATTAFVPDNALPRYEELFQQIYALMSNILNIDEADLRKVLEDIHIFATSLQMNVTIVTPPA